ncbi:ABC transporter permease [Rhodanobacter sp. DHB23]|uniref:ABC transporter permease n=1 Tax=Rhodanobacter sp. DHB23 TaxID=2775923 RepID=UPI00177E96AB|nr:ABC transporter permease [Rhodanobacter sp. DHB23]MBD8874390.1 ABC transporter permease [Rhodanobacter sp. DHB23]
MFGYYLELAMRSMKRSPGLTALMILAIGFGVAASMTMYSVFRGLSADPIPWKSSRLFVPQIDIWGPGFREPGGEPQSGLDYIDAMALMRRHRAIRQSAIYSLSSSTMPDRATGSASPIPVRGYAVYSGFFPMLDVPFRYGGSWSEEEDARRAPVAVISDHLNRQVFGGGDNVGKTIEVGGRAYRIAGILAYWNPQPDFFADLQYRVDAPDVFLPFQYVVETRAIGNAGANCKRDADDPGTDFEALLHSDCTWISFMVELDDAAAARAYREYLDAYAVEQQKVGRFNWAPNNRLRDVPALLDHEHVIPGTARVSLLVAQGLLLVCLVNTVGLLLAKFLRRSGEIAVRRALGASRAAVCAQCLIEAGLIGLGGGILGLLLTIAGVHAVGLVMPAQLAALAGIDPGLLSSALLLAMVATLLAGAYPAHRASRVPPALKLKGQ